jgi:lactate permease
MFTQHLTPVANSLTLSALIALLPLITIFILLGALRLKAHWAGLASLGVALIVAFTAFRMPARIGMVLFMCVLVYLQSTPVLGWMLP